MTQSSCKRETKSKSHPDMKVGLVQVFSCKHPLYISLAGLKPLIIYLSAICIPSTSVVVIMSHIFKKCSLVQFARACLNKFSCDKSIKRWIIEIFLWAFVIKGVIFSNDETRPLSKHSSQHVQQGFSIIKYQQLQDPAEDLRDLFVPYINTASNEIPLFMI